MAYNQYTLSRLQSEITSTLSDASNVYWSAAEIQSAIKEAMREWSGVTTYWRERGNISITNSPFVQDISTLLPTLRPRSVTIDSIVREIQFHLYEPSNGFGGAGMSQQFTINEILQAVVHARNRFVLDAHIPLQFTSGFTFSNAVDGRFFLDPSTVYLHEAWWLDAAGVYFVLNRSDEWAQDSFPASTGLRWIDLQQTWASANFPWSGGSLRPVCFSQAVERPTEVRVYPTASNGTLDLITANSLDIQVSQIGATTSAHIPDDFAHAIKYLAMSELLRLDSEAHDPFRANYCRFRYDSIIHAALTHRSVLRAQVAGTPIGLVPMYSLDTLRPYWHNRSSPSGPDVAGTAYDLLAVSPLPQSAVSIDLDVARSAPVPTGSNSVILMGIEEIASIISYCQHYLAFKLGGEEFRSTFPHFDSFQSHALERNAILSTQSRYLRSLFDQPKWDEAKNPDAAALDASHPASMLWESRRQLGGAR